uniref:RRM domain-containing protein n=1 Tax=Cannabis sativa TaxID=3483 RepID=A0A803PQD2_CANSA
MVAKQDYRIFVGGLSWNVIEHQLEDAFDHFGKALEAQGMRKEFAHARALAISQAQVLHAHDEIKMTTTRLHLEVDENDKSFYALTKEELPSASVQYSSDKFMALHLLPL